MNNIIKNFLNEKFFTEYKSNKFIIYNIILSSIVLILISFIANQLNIISIYFLLYILLFYYFFTFGKEGGFIIVFIITFIFIIEIMISEREYTMFYVFLVIFTILYMIKMGAYIDKYKNIEKENEIMFMELGKEKVELENKYKKIISQINASKKRIKNYEVLNKVANKLTSVLEKEEVNRIISNAVKELMEEKNININLLIYNEETKMFEPIGENEKEKPIIGSSIKIHRKDPFDEWVEKNKFTLFIKNINDDFRFRTLRKDWINFSSMVAIPLIENKRIIGILKIFSKDIEAFNKEDVRILNYLGDLCTTAVENSILYQKTKELAIRDGLTGLYMRRYFIEKLEDEIKRAKQLKTTFSFLMIDIDHFKECNDTHGHLFGDKVLRILGEFLKDNLRDVDVIGRYGGEEFAVILPNTNLNGAHFVAERLRQGFEKLLIQVNENEGIRVTLSIGGVEYKPGMKLMEVINTADKALYYSKQNGRNRVTFWEDIN